MSEPVTNVEIEDVLSSIRRLISEDGRGANAQNVGRRVTSQPLPPPEPAPVDWDAEADAIAAAVSADAPEPAVEPQEPDRLVLTPALRVLTNDPEESADAPLPLENPQIAGVAALVSEVVEPEPEPETSEPEQGSEPEMRHEPEPQASPEEGPELSADLSEDVEAQAEPTPAPEIDEEPAETAPEPLFAPVAETLAEAIGRDVVAEPEAEPEPQPEASAEAVENTDAVEDAEDTQDVIAVATEEDASSMDLRSRSDALQVLSAEVDEPAAETPMAEPVEDAPVAEAEDVPPMVVEPQETNKADLTHRFAELERAFDREPVSDYEPELDDTASPDDAGLTAPIPFRHVPRSEAPRPNPMVEEEISGLDLDEDALRDLIAEIIRQELQGALGERITRNVRKLVRREIHRALASQEID